MELKHLGKTGSEPIDYLEGFPAPLGVGIVELETSELECHCPVTGQPDIYRAKISYQPNKLCVETKSLKMYLWSFRAQSKFAEALACEIADTFYQHIEPLWVTVELVQNVRGGIVLTVQSTAIRSIKKGEDSE